MILYWRFWRTLDVTIRTTVVLLTKEVGHHVGSASQLLQIQLALAVFRWNMLRKHLVEMFNIDLLVEVQPLTGVVLPSALAFLHLSISSLGQSGTPS
jgi:hypothetical protein